MGQRQVLKEIVETWKLSLDNWHWERLTFRNWTQFEIRRQDQGGLYLFLIRMALWNLKSGQEAQYQELMSNLSELLGHQPDVKRIEDLYHFDLKHGELQKVEDTHNVYFINLEGAGRYRGTHTC